MRRSKRVNQLQHKQNMIMDHPEAAQDGTHAIKLRYGQNDDSQTCNLSPVEDIATYLGAVSASGPGVDVGAIGAGNHPPYQLCSLFFPLRGSSIRCWIGRERTAARGRQRARPKVTGPFVHCQKTYSAVGRARVVPLFAGAATAWQDGRKGFQRIPTHACQLMGWTTTSPENEMGIFEFPLEGFLVFLVHARNEEERTNMVALFPVPMDDVLAESSSIPSRWEPCGFVQADAGEKLQKTTRNGNQEILHGSRFQVTEVGFTACRGQPAIPSSSTAAGLAASAITVHLDLVPPCGGGAEMHVMPCLRLCFFVVTRGFGEVSGCSILREADRESESRSEPCG